MRNTPSPECHVTAPHGEHMITVLSGPFAGAHVDCAGV